MAHRGFWPWGIQTGSLAACWTDFAKKLFYLFAQPPIITQFFIVQREEGRKEQGMEIGKGNSPKVDGTQGFLTLGHSNWIIGSLLNWFCQEIILPFCPASHNNPILYSAERGRKEGAGDGNWKRELPKSGWHTGVSDLGAFKLDHWQPVDLILSRNYSAFLPSLPWQPNSLYCRERKEGAGAGNWKRELPKSGWHTGVSDLGAFKLDHWQPVELILSKNVLPFLPSLP